MPRRGLQPHRPLLRRRDQRHRRLGSLRLLLRDRVLPPPPRTARNAAGGDLTGAAPRPRLPRRSGCRHRPPQGPLAEGGPGVRRSERRAAVRRWLDAGLVAVDPELLTASALSPRSGAAVTVIAIGKAAPGMCRGAVRALGQVAGVCVTNAPAPVPEGIELFIGDHPLPGERSLAAGRRVLEVARAARGRCIALISGGGSALCELPVPGIGLELLQRAGAALLDGGASIEEINLVRSHLSAIKGGGLARAVSGDLETWVISDVGPAGPEVVASGPTIPRPRNPERVLEILDVYGIPLSFEERAAIA
ncbi:MAG TPA: DUF4147 domain-containing protein, partial [Acidimicrobiia bacterium]|nr:DUF4147 domain-containing protein [Acidimicrobiia bacterium]